MLNDALRKGYSDKIKNKASDLGFSDCGIAEADFLDEDAENYELWLARGMHGKMSYMERNIEKRLDPRKLVTGAKSVIVLLQNYYPAQRQTGKEAPVLSKSAYGEDYHFVLKDKMYDLLNFIRKEIGRAEGRVFTDSAPVLERSWAERAGLGKRGKNSNLLTKNGSFFFIGELILDIELAYDSPIDKTVCGTCTLCRDACPTGALSGEGFIDSRRCISYLTTELREQIPSVFKGKLQNRIFGCDICQDVCPYNKKAEVHKEPRLKAKPQVLSMSKADWYNMDKALFNHLFKKSTIKRAKYSGLMRNLDFIRER